MLAGRHPFEGETALGVAVQHLQAAPPRLETLRPDLPAPLCRIVHTLLEKQPDQRYASARELLRELRPLATDGGDLAWPDNLDVELGLPVAELAARTAATQQLQVALNLAQPTRRSRAQAPIAWIVALVAAAGLGGAIATTRREPFALDRFGTAHVSQLADAAAQLDMAQSLASEDWLLSVEEHFPGATAEVRQARQDLARLYLEQERWQDALEIFAVLDKGLEPVDRAFALAGKCFVYYRLDRPEETAQTLAELAGVLKPNVRLDPEFLPLVRRADEYVRRTNNQQHDEAWRKMLDQLGEEDSDPADE
jgi:serine/threonine-protein kinase